MKRYKFLILLAGSIFCLPQVKAQFSLSGEFRPRTEFSHGYQSLAEPEQELSAVTSQRTRLNAAYQTEWLKTRLVLQDVRIWGSQPQLVGNENNAASIHEAWAEILLTHHLSLKVGRQELIYDDHRIFGNVGWAQQARSHDLALLKLEHEFNLHLGVAHHEDNDPKTNIYTGPDAYKDLQFLWFNKKWDKTTLSLLFLNNGAATFKTTDRQITRYTQTIGGRISQQAAPVTLAGNLYFQTGKNSTGKNVSALNLMVEASLKNGLSAAWEHLSGNSYDKNDNVYAFNPYFGTNHKFNGYMDYFYVGNHINSVGLNDLRLSYNYQKEKTAWEGSIHYFSSAGKISAEAKKYLGTEIDLGITYALRPMASLSAGWSLMLAGESMELLKGGDHSVPQYWGYLMLTVVPAFIHSQ